MATRGTIAVQHADGTVSQVYAHWDNYVEHTGKMLQKWYNTQEAAESLIALGDISTVENSIARTEYYGCDCGEDEDDTASKVFKDIQEYVTKMDGQEFNYLFTDGKWYVEHYYTDGEYKELLEEIRKIGPFREDK